MQHQQEFEHTSNTPEEMPAPLKLRTGSGGIRIYRWQHPLAQ